MVTSLGACDITYNCLFCVNYCKVAISIKLGDITGVLFTKQAANMGLGDIAGVLFTIQVANTGLCLRRKVQHL
jgi:hypothetical protein